MRPPPAGHGPDRSSPESWSQRPAVRRPRAPPSADVTSIVDDPYADSAGVMSRINTYLNLEKFGSDSIRLIDQQYSSLRELQLASSPTFDDSDLATDSSGGTLKGMDMSNNFHFETLDQEKNQWFSGDSDLYYSQLDSAGWL